jgi:hypothetical protein
MAITHIPCANNANINVKTIQPRRLLRLFFTNLCHCNKKRIFAKMPKNGENQNFDANTVRIGRLPPKSLYALKRGETAIGHKNSIRIKSMTITHPSQSNTINSVVECSLANFVYL